MSAQTPTEDTMTDMSPSPVDSLCPEGQYYSGLMTGVFSGMAGALVLTSLCILAYWYRRRFSTQYKIRESLTDSEGNTRERGTRPGPFRSETVVDYEPVEVVPMSTVESSEETAQRSKAATLQTHAEQVIATDGQTITADDGQMPTHKIPEKPRPYKAHRLATIKTERKKPGKEDQASPQTPPPMTQESRQRDSEQNKTTTPVYAVVVKNKSE